MAGETVPHAPNVNLLFGPILIGVMLNMILYGIMVMQVLIYHNTYKNDHWYIKALVWYLFIIETINTGLDIGVVYEPLIVRYATIDATKYIPTTFTAEPITIAIISTPIQLFIAWRIRKISKSLYIPVAILLLGLTSLAGGIWTTYAISKVRVFARKSELHTPALVWLLSSAVADVLLTGSLVAALYRKKTGFKAMDSVINRIIRLTVQTGLITAVCAVADVIFFMTLPHITLNFIWDLALTKIYANSLMSTLNARAGLNSIVNPTTEPNFLFDDTTEATSMSRRSYGVGAVRSAGGFHSPRANLYELESTGKSHFTSSRHTTDHPYGIAVTIDKVVETIQDPIPSPTKRYSSGDDRDVERVAQ